MSATPKSAPDDALTAFNRVEEDAMKAVAYFHTWWGFRGPDSYQHEATFANSKYVDFFNACRSGFLALTFVSLGKLFDPRGLGLQKLGKALYKQGRTNEAKFVKSIEPANQHLVRRIRAIRNKSVGHNQPGMSRDDVYKTYGVTPNEISGLVEEIRTALNEVGQGMGFTNVISAGSRQESAVNEVLRQLGHE